MPELPEVETTLRGIEPHIVGKIVKNVTIRQYDLRWPIPRNLRQKLLNNKLEQLQRRGKYLLLKFSTGTVILHLGMSGRLQLLRSMISPQKHDHFDITFSNEIILRFTDPRRFGVCLWINKDPHSHALLKHLGLEPLHPSFNGKYLWQQAQNRKVAVKTFIMEQKIVVGVGNIYANEALFSAGIHPLTPANQIPFICYQHLAKAIKTILRQAIKRGGTTLRDFLDSSGKPGYFVNYLQVYDRESLPCVHCHTILKAVRINQRNTVFCGRCQLKE